MSSDKSPKRRLRGAGRDPSVQLEGMHACTKLSRDTSLGTNAVPCCPVSIAFFCPALVKSSQVERGTGGRERRAGVRGWFSLDADAYTCACTPSPITASSAPSLFSSHAEDLLDGRM